MNKKWRDTNTLTRMDAIKILIRVTDRDDPYWEDLTEEYYDEKNNTMLIFDDILKALGVTDEELCEAWCLRSC